jgi:hypothetical protein
MPRRYLGGVFGNTIASDTGISQSTGVFSMEQQYYMKQEGGWVFGLGEDSSLPASSAKALYDSGNRANGTYWLKHGSNAAYQTYCWIDANSGGGYHLVGKIDNTNPSVWYYSGARWSASSPANESNCQDLSNTEGLNRGYYQYSLQTGFRLAMHYSAPTVITNYLSESKTGNVAKHFFTNSGSTQNNRNNFVSLFQGAGNDNGFITNFNNNQPNCNQAGFLQTSSSHSIRWGIAGNNENDCSTNDSTIGFGGQHYGGQGSNAAGGQASHASHISRPVIGYIFVQ